MDSIDDELVRHFEIASSFEDDRARLSYLADLERSAPDYARRIRESLAAQASGTAFFSRFDSPPAGRTSDADMYVGSMATRSGRFKRFRLERLVGRGGMGAVYFGIDEQLFRPVAVKIPRLDLLGDSKTRQRFLREARIAAQLDHPNLVRILEVGESGPWCYLVSQWCPSGDLANWLDEHDSEVDPEEIAGFVRELALGIQHCHEHGVIHLDLKPANVILSPRQAPLPRHGVETGRPLSKAIPLGGLIPKITDFGLARPAESLAKNTRSSLLLGTPLYMSPEQAESRWRDVGPHSDLFAVGVILYELLYGRRPFDGSSVVEVIDEIRNPDGPTFPKRQYVPRPLRQICRKCLQYRREDRYREAAELVEDLQRYVDGNPLRFAAGSLTSQLGQRLRRWFVRPDRVTQAGYIAFGIQAAVMLNLVTYLTLDLLGIKLPGNVAIAPHVGDLIMVIICLHVPSIALAYATLRRSRLGYVAGLTLSGVFVAAALAPLFGLAQPIGFYKGRHLLSFLMHAMVAALASMQLLFYLLAAKAISSPRRR